MNTESGSLFLSSYQERERERDMMMMNGVMILEDSMSQLTSGVSNEAVSISSSSRNELVAGATSTLYSQQPPFAISPNQPPPPKKKRNLPGNPGNSLTKLYT